MTRVVVTPFDVAEHLRTPEEMVSYLEACTEIAEGDAAFMAAALDDIARAKKMARPGNKAVETGDRAGSPSPDEPTPSVPRRPRVRSNTKARSSRQ